MFETPPPNRTEIMLSARMAYLSGKTVADCPEKFKPWEQVWRYEWQQCDFEKPTNTRLA